MFTLTFWQWWLVGVVLVIIEMLVPGSFFLWMGLAATLVGLLLLLIPGMNWQWQLFFFSMFSVIIVVLWKRYATMHPQSNDSPHLNRRGEQNIGRTVTLTQAIEDGFGKVKIDDTFWKVSGHNLAVGVKVTVTGVQGTTLEVVENPPAEQSHSDP